MILVQGNSQFIQNLTITPVTLTFPAASYTAFRVVTGGYVYVKVGWGKEVQVEADLYLTPNIPQIIKVPNQSYFDGTGSVITVSAQVDPQNATPSETYFSATPVAEY